MSKVFVKVLSLVFCIVLLGCGFYFAQKPVLIGSAQNINIREIKNSSRAPNIDFLLARELQNELIIAEVYTQGKAELELLVTITSAIFSVTIKKQTTGEFYIHSYRVKVKILVDDLRNLQPAKKEKEFVAEVYLESRDKVLDGNQQDKLQLSAIYALVEQTLSFVLQ